jgi:hypothetical protein
MIDDGSTSLHIHRPPADCSKYPVKFVLLFLIFFVGCSRDVVVPGDLIGVWETAAPKYADRHIKFSEHTLTYGIGEGKEVSHQIEKIDIAQGDGRTIYTFYYRDAEGEKWNLTLSYSPDSGGTIKIKNSDDIWKRSSQEKPDK